MLYVLFGLFGIGASISLVVSKKKYEIEKLENSLAKLLSYYGNCETRENDYDAIIKKIKNINEFFMSEHTVSLLKKENKTLEQEISLLMVEYTKLKSIYDKAKKKEREKEEEERRKRRRRSSSSSFYSSSSSSSFGGGGFSGGGGWSGGGGGFSGGGASGGW